MKQETMIEAISAPTQQQQAQRQTAPRVGDVVLANNMRLGLVTRVSFDEQGGALLSVALVARLGGGGYVVTQERTVYRVSELVAWQRADRLPVLGVVTAA